MCDIRTTAVKLDGTTKRTAYTAKTQKAMSVHWLAEHGEEPIPMILTDFCGTDNVQRYREEDESLFLECIQHAFGKQTVHHRKRLSRDNQARQRNKKNIKVRNQRAERETERDEDETIEPESETD